MLRILIQARKNYYGAHAVVCSRLTYAFTIIMVENMHIFQQTRDVANSIQAGGGGGGGETGGRYIWQVGVSVVREAVPIPM